MGVPVPTQFRFDQLLVRRVPDYAFSRTVYRDDLPTGLRQVTVWRRAGERIDSEHGLLPVVGWLKAEARRINQVNPRRRACVVREQIRQRCSAHTRVALFAVEPWRVG